MLHVAGASRSAPRVGARPREVGRAPGLPGRGERGAATRRTV